MVQLSPRSYVFTGLEYIREPLIHFIWKKLKNSKDWWHRYIYKHLNKTEYYRGKVPRAGKHKDLLNLLDELECFKIIEKNKSLFKDAINMKHISELHETRNRCAHVFKEGGIIDKDIAANALSEMAILMRKIDSECCEKLSLLRNDLHEQEYTNKKVKASKETLVNFLKDRIWDPSFDMLDNSQSIDSSLKKQLKNKMRKAYDEISGFETAEEVEQWFRKHLYSKEGIKMYDELKSIKDIDMPTFEDNRNAFMQLCYGE
jgi:hypothetical protein